MWVERQAYLIDLLTKKVPEENWAEIQFLKKLTLLFNIGDLRINDQSPNDKYPLSSYLLDEHRTIIDWSHLSEKNQYKIRKWLFTDQQAGFHSLLLAPYKISEVNGKPEEVKLGLWARFVNTLLFRRRYYSFHLNPRFIPDIFSLKDIDICLSRQGALVDMVPQFQLIAKEENKAAVEYEDEGEQNVKRLVLTNRMMDAIFSKKVSEFDYASILSEPHPHAITSYYPKSRQERMREHRRNNQYYYRPNLLIRLWRFCKNWFWGIINKQKKEQVKKVYEPLFKTGSLNVFIEKMERKEKGIPINGQIYVTEKKPPIKIFVFSGGGAKIFGHLGAVQKVMEAGISANTFAGSSSGAIFAMLLYLGYTIEDIEKQFSHIKQHFLLEEDVRSEGLSTPDALKDAILFLIKRRIVEIVKRYQERFAEGEAYQLLIQYIDKNYYTFRVLEMLKRICPEEPIGERLLVTGTDLTDQKTTLFSFETTPDMEIAEAVKISASMPVLYHPTTLNGHLYTDGGCTHNIPLKYFRDDESSFLSHNLDANFGVLGYQFNNNGVETDVLHSSRPVYRESWLINKIYEFLTKVKDPATWWVRERRELRKYACQTIIINTDGVRASNFDITNSVRNKIKWFGGRGASEYIDPRYMNVNINVQRPKREEDTYEEGPELLHQTFENLEELMCYAAFRGDETVLDEIARVVASPERQFDSDYVEHLLLVRLKLKEEKKSYDKFSKLRKKQALDKLPMGRILKSRDTKVTKVSYHIQLNCLLFSLLMIRWNALYSGETQSVLEPYVDKLENFRQSLRRSADNQPSKLMFDMALYFESTEGETHIIIALLKTLIIHCKNAPISDVTEEFQLLRDVMRDVSWLKTIEDQSLLMGEWRLDLSKTRELLTIFASEAEDKVDIIKRLLSMPGLKSEKDTVDRPFFIRSSSSSSDIFVNSPHLP